jgi:4-amino-4-deoxy-L-arabinose transferase-like glycosyltransferase
MITFYWTLVVLLVASRFVAFRPDLDHPHLFRQADTAFYSAGFHRFGMNLFEPSVGWMGSYRHVALEFPLTEWIAAAVYSLTGPTILVDRMVNLGFFLGSTFFLHRVVRFLADDTMAKIVTLLYMAAPLGVYYSRAVHIDFTAVCFAHALLFHALRYVDRGHRRDLLLATAAGTLAFVIKAPYAFYLTAPIAAYAALEPDRRPRLVPVLAVFAWSAAAFCGWFGYTQWLNRQAPDLSFIPSYERHVGRYRWYVGSLADRTRLDAWSTVVGRVYREIAVTVWWAIVPLGFFARGRRGYVAVALAWSAGTAVYLLVFFTLNENHNYYQIPFIAPFCLWLAMPIHACWSAGGTRARAGRAAAALLLTGYVASSLYVVSQRFYRTDAYHLAVGRFIQAATSDADLIVMAHWDAVHGDPSFLFYARRYGWSVGHAELSPHVIEGLRPHGATLVVTSTARPPSELTRQYLARWPLVETARIDGHQLSIHRLAAARPWP